MYLALYHRLLLSESKSLSNLCLCFWTCASAVNLQVESDSVCVIRDRLSIARRQSGRCKFSQLNKTKAMSSYPEQLRESYITYFNIATARFLPEEVHVTSKSIRTPQSRIQLDIRLLEIKIIHVPQCSWGPTDEGNDRIPTAGTAICLRIMVPSQIFQLLRKKFDFT